MLPNRGTSRGEAEAHRAAAGARPRWSGRGKAAGRKLPSLFGFAFTMMRLRVLDSLTSPYPKTATIRHREQARELRRLAEQGRQSGLSDEDDEATLGCLQRVERRRLS